MRGPGLAGMGAAPPPAVSPLVVVVHTPFLHVVVDVCVSADGPPGPLVDVAVAVPLLLELPLAPGLVDVAAPGPGAELQVSTHSPPVHERLQARAEPPERPPKPPARGGRGGSAVASPSPHTRVVVAPSESDTVVVMQSPETTFSVHTPLMQVRDVACAAAKGASATSAAHTSARARRMMPGPLHGTRRGRQGSRGAGGGGGGAKGGPGGGPRGGGGGGGGSQMEAPAGSRAGAVCCS